MNTSHCAFELNNYLHIQQKGALGLYFPSSTVFLLMLGLQRAVTVYSANEKTRAIADKSTVSAGFTCPGYHLPRRDETYRFLLFSSASRN
jgi:hypothetical protein